MGTRLCLTFVLLVAAVSACYAAADWPPQFIKSDPANNRLVDDQGRSIIFHGVNAVSKVKPYSFEVPEFDPHYSFVDEDIKNLKSWGMNIVRLGVMWPGVEPEQGQYNATYIAVMKNLVDRLYDHGIFTIVDMHQDSMTEKYCGEGFPGWAVHSDYPSLPFPQPIQFTPYHKDKNGIPLREECQSKLFAQYLFASEQAVSWQDFFENNNGFQDHFVKFWGYVADQFKAVPGVLGYEIINEPFPGNVYAHPQLFLPGHADKVHLEPLYKRVHEEIRSKDTKKIIFYEPMPGFDSYTASGFTQGPGGPEYDDRQVYSYHVYCIQKKNGDPVNPTVCRALDSYLISERAKDAARIKNVPLITEFGAAPNGTLSAEEISRICNNADRRLTGWVYWQFKDFGDITTAGDNLEGLYDGDGNLQQAKLRALSYPYAAATAGKVQAMAYDEPTGVFTLNYDYEGTGSTVVMMAAAVHYPHGFDVATSGMVTATSTDNGVVVTHDSALAVGQRVSLTITPKQAVVV